MNKDARTREAQTRVIEVFKKRPQAALNTNHATAVVEDGLICTFTQGEHRAIMDMPEIMGGEDAGPTPGFFTRAGIADARFASQERDAAQTATSIVQRGAQERHLCFPSDEVRLMVGPTCMVWCHSGFYIISQ